jgi:hypothetical protein
VILFLLPAAQILVVLLPVEITTCLPVMQNECRPAAHNEGLQFTTRPEAKFLVGDWGDKVHHGKWLSSLIPKSGTKNLVSGRQQ